MRNRIKDKSHVPPQISSQNRITSAGLCVVVIVGVVTFLHSFRWCFFSGLPVWSGSRDGVAELAWFRCVGNQCKVSLWTSSRRGLTSYGSSGLASFA